MANMNMLLEDLQLVSAFVPVDMQTGANAGDWISLENYDRVIAVLFKAAGTAGDDPIFKLQQATDASGTSAKDLTFTEIYEKIGTQTAAAQHQWTKQTQTASATYTNAASAEAEAIIAVEVKGEDLDGDNGFTHMQLSVADTGTNAQLGCGFYVLGSPRYKRAPASMLGAQT